MLIIAVDYDGTIINDKTHQPRWNVIKKIQECMKTDGCEIVLWTCREHEHLKEAFRKCDKLGIAFDSINDCSPCIKNNVKMGNMYVSRKLFADLYVDDRAPGSIDFFLSLNIKQTVKQFMHKEKIEPIKDNYFKFN